MNKLDRDYIDQALARLGERLDQTAIAPIAMLVCGGASLIATRMVSRQVTKDIEEMETAARWVMRQDPSEGFRTVLKDMLRKIGYGQAAERI